MDVIGRRRADLSPAQIDADLQAVAALFTARDAKFHEAAHLRTEPLHDVIVGRLRPAIETLLLGVGLLLLATCATMAGVLLAGAGLLGMSVHRLLQVSPGFDPHGLVTMRLSLPDRYADTAKDFMDRLVERLEAIPGATGAAAINQGPLTGIGNTGTLSIVERTQMPGGSPPELGLQRVTPNYFSVMGTKECRRRVETRILYKQISI